MFKLINEIIDLFSQENIVLYIYNFIYITVCLVGAILMHIIVCYKSTSVALQHFKTLQFILGKSSLKLPSSPTFAAAGAVN